MSEKPEGSQLSNQQQNSERTLRDKLLKTLNERFSMSDLKTLVFKLRKIDDEIDFENIVGMTKQEKARQLVQYMERRRKLPALKKAIEHELTIPRRVSRWFHQGQNIFIVSIVGIIAVTIVALVILPFLKLKGLNTTGISPTASNIPKPTYPPPPPPQVTLHSFEACRPNFYQDFEDKLSIISDLEILPPGETTSLEINGRCYDQEIILSFTIHEKAPVFLQVATPDSITMTLPDNTDLQILGQLGRAFIYYTDNQFKNAYKTFSEIEKTLPLPNNIYLLMANSQLLSYEYEQAITRYQILLAQSDEYDQELKAALHNNLGMAYFNSSIEAELASVWDKSGEYHDKAMSEFEQGLADENQIPIELSAMLYTNLSLANMWITEFSKAKTSCDLVRDKTPGNPWADICAILPDLFELQFDPSCNYDKLQEINNALQNAQTKNADLADAYYWQSISSDILITAKDCGLDENEIDKIRQSCQSQYEQFQLKYVQGLAPLQTHLYMNHQENAPECTPLTETYNSRVTSLNIIAHLGPTYHALLGSQIQFKQRVK